MLTDRFFHIHIGRTGGSAFRKILRQMQAEEDLVIHDPEEWGQHTNFAKMNRWAWENGVAWPPGVAFVRHPKTWYLSCWCFVNQYEYHGFKGIDLRTWLDYVQVTGIYSGPFNTMPLSAHWQWMGCDTCQHVGKFENLYDDVDRILHELMPDIVAGWNLKKSLAFLDEVNEERVVRRSLVWPDMKPLSQYDPDSFWEPDLIERVKRWDGKFMERFGYTW